MQLLPHSETPGKMPGVKPKRLAQGSIRVGKIGGELCDHPSQFVLVACLVSLDEGSDTLLVSVGLRLLGHVFDFGQLVLEIENRNEERLRKADSAGRVAFYVQRGRELLDQGLATEAGKQFQKALALDPSQAAAHAGLARALELSQDKAGARREAQASLRLASSAEAYLVLARLDLADNNSMGARQNVEHALALDPANAAAVALKHDIAAGSVGKSGPP